MTQVENPDTGTIVNPDLCSGPLPVMTVRDVDGGAIAPDWSCYLPAADGGSNFFALDDASDDAATDAADASTPVVDAGSDAATDSGQPAPDSGPPTADGGAPDASTSPYLMHVVDFSTLQPPVGANVDIFWGDSTEGTPNFSGTLDSNGLLSYGPPPAGTLGLSYHLHSTDAGAASQVGVYWHGVIIVPPGVNAGTAGDGQDEVNSVSTSTQQALITAVFGSEQAQANLGVLVTAARDCQGRELEGAQLKLVDAKGTDVLTSGSGAAAPRAWYYVNDVPNTSCTFTNNNQRAIWTIANAPVNEPGDTAVYTLQMIGRMTESDGPNGVVISSTPTQLYSGAISVARPYKQTLSQAPNRGH